jgi:signal transduction histidine kinase
MILGEATRCKTIVGGLLDFARQNKVTRSQVDVPMLLHEAVNIVQAGRDDSVRYEVIAPDDLPQIWLDRDQMLQVLLNIIRNAVELMPRGGQIRVKAEHVEARAELHISVRDTGPGMSPETQQKMFTPFFTTKPVGKGTGLGLPICYGIVKMHRGTITARNNADGPGATFEITIPSAPEERAANPPAT